MDRIETFETEADEAENGQTPDPGITESRGDQERPMTEEEALEHALEESMDGSDPPSITQPGKEPPAPPA